MAKMAKLGVERTTHPGVAAEDALPDRQNDQVRQRCATPPQPPISRMTALYDLLVFVAALSYLIYFMMGYS